MFPAFLFLAGCGLCMGLAYTLYRVETRGKALALDDAAKPIARGQSPQVRTT